MFLDQAPRQRDRADLSPAGVATVLGVTLLVKGYRPRLTAVLVAAALPGMAVIPMFLSLGSIVLPPAFGWAIAARRIGSGGT